MKKHSLVLLVFVCLCSFFSTSCKKINEATELGSDLIPPVDNVTTFEAFLETETDNADMSLTDTSVLLYDDAVAIGHLSSDPEFGQTQANAYFNISAPAYGSYPFKDKASVSVDSVVLSLSYTGAYGDTNAMQTVRVYEIDPNAALSDTVLYQYNHDDLATTGSELGSKTFTPSTLDDTVSIITKDTTKVAKVLRIRLDKALGTRFASYDTSGGSNGGFKNDSIFQTLFKGLAIKADESGNTLSYFNVFDEAKTKLSVYFTYTTSDNKKDTASADFTHKAIQSITFTYPAGVVNSIKRTKGGNWATYLANGDPKDDKLFIQSAPGSFATIKVPAFDTMTNKVVHLAELIAYKIPSASDNTFTPPARLFLDHVTNAGDSAFLFDKDINLTSQQISLGSFGGNLRTDNTIHFNITRYVQSLITKKEPNHILRLYAPLRTVLYNNSSATKQKISVPVLSDVANGRIVVAGGNYGDPSMRLRVRVVYSKL